MVKFLSLSIDISRPLSLLPPNAEYFLLSFVQSTYFLLVFLGCYGPEHCLFLGSCRFSQPNNSLFCIGLSC